MSTKVWTHVEVYEQLRADPRWVRRAILALFQQQTADERRAGKTRYLNDRGFTGFDARAATCYARKFSRGDRLTSQQWDSARRIALKHVGQLVDIANGRLGEL